MHLSIHGSQRGRLCGPHFIPHRPPAQAKAASSCMDFSFHMAVTQWSEKVRASCLGQPLQACHAAAKRHGTWAAAGQQWSKAVKLIEPKLALAAWIAERHVCSASLPLWPHTAPFLLNPSLRNAPSSLFLNALPSPPFRPRQT